MDFAKFNDKTLLYRAKILARRERKITLIVLRYLREIERRMIFAKLGYPSLFEFAVKELGYSESSAHRRISSMRLCRSLPAVEEKLERGELNLTLLSMAQSFFHIEKIDNNETKAEILRAVEGHSTRDAQKILMSQSQSPERHRRESAKLISTRSSLVTVVLPDNVMQQINEVRSLLSHAHPHMKISDVLSLSVGEFLKNLQKKKFSNAENAISSRSNSARAPNALPAPKVGAAPNKTHARYIPMNLRRAVWTRDGGRCTYVEPASKRRCCSKHLLELDHIVPFASGGWHSLENLRLRCRLHNQLSAIQMFGVKKMQNYLPKIAPD